MPAHAARVDTRSRAGGWRQASGPCKWIAAVVLGGLLVGDPLHAATAASDEAVKAAFLYRFGAYVAWPSRIANDAPFTIGTVGGEGVTAELKKMLPGLSIQGHPVRVLSVSRPGQLGEVQILYLGPSVPARRARLLALAADKPILVVTDEAAGLLHGVTINFVHVGADVRFEVSLAAAEHSGLKIDAGLLAIATRVEGRPRADRDSGHTPIAGASARIIPTSHRLRECHRTSLTPWATQAAAPHHPSRLRSLSTSWKSML